MKNKFKNIVLVIALIFSASNALAQTTSFTYQGKLTDGGSPANAQYDFTFKLYDSVSGGTQIGSDVLSDDVQVTAGIFSVNLDFGSSPFTSYTGNYLEIAVRPGVSMGAYTTLAPRQPITAAPYAVQTIRAMSAAVADNALNLDGVNASQYVQTTDSRLSDARIPTTGSNDYLQNTNSPQTASFNITGTGIANIFRAEAQFNIGANRVLGNRCPFNLNVGIGAGAGEDVGCGIAGNTRNSFFGTNAGFSNVFGADNVYVGFEAGRNSGSGQSNTFVGVKSGFSNGVGQRNTYLGANAGENSGSLAVGNTFIGASTGLSNTLSGKLITILGFQANVSSDGLLNATAIGANSLVSQDNSLVLGSIANVNGATANTNVGIGTSAPNYKLHVVGENVRVEGNTTSTFPRFSLNFTGGGADMKKWQNYATTNALSFSALNDAENAETRWLLVTRGTGTTIGSVMFPNGNVVINNLGGAGSTSLCRNGFNEISTCTPGNLTSENTEILDALRKQLKLQQQEIDELKQIVCAIKPDADVCKE